VEEGEEGRKASGSPKGREGFFTLWRVGATWASLLCKEAEGSS